MAIARSAHITVLVVLSAVLLTACADSAATETVTLADTKSPVQLLRNEAASRVPEAQIVEILNTQDESTSCRTPESDPDGLQRSWRSIIRFQLVYDADADAVIDDLVASFVDQGWDEGIYGTAAIVELTRAGSETNIHISSKKANDDEQVGAEVQLAVAGPCVMTGGRTSDEVVKLGPVDGE